MVKDKCGALKIDFKAGKELIIRTEKEKLVLKAFKALGVDDDNIKGDKGFAHF